MNFGYTLHQAERPKTPAERSFSWASPIVRPAIAACARAGSRRFEKLIRHHPMELLCRQWLIRYHRP